MSEPQRLQRYLASAGVSSRRGGEALITEGRISVNGEVVKELGTSVHPQFDVVRVDGVRVSREPKHFYLFHKPVGILTTLDDPFDRPSLREVTRELPVRVFPVGRLDLDVFGLLLLTNDGEYAHTLMHPSFGAKRRYLAQVRGVPSEEALAKLCAGVSLEDGEGKALSAIIYQDEDRIKTLFGSNGNRANPRSVVDLSVGEGRNHFVKRLLQAVAHPVLKLCRVEFGPYELGDLETGELRQLETWGKAS